MGLIVRNLVVRGDRGEAEARILFDTGASESLVSRTVAERVATLVHKTHPRRFRLGDGKTFVESSEVAVIELPVDGKIVDAWCYVFPDLAYDMIIGASTFQMWDIRLSPKSETFTVGIDPDNIPFA